LVAEDNEINALMVKSALIRAGHSVTVVGDGRSAVNEVNAHPDAHDLVLMDLHMPVMDGLDAIAAIRNGEDEHGRRPVPILALTADGQAEIERAVRSVGGNGYVTKPVDPARLIGLIEETAAAA
jgi:CheY-like chemotaxis protein